MAEDQDKELAAMSSVLAALKELEPEAQERVLRWAASRFSIRLGTSMAKQGALANEGTGVEFQDFPSLYDAANPKTQPDKALVAAYWFQVRQGQSELDAQRLNTALKNLGHGVSNITDALGSLKGRTPALILQTQKSGKSKQARKKYKLTTAGISAVKTMLTGSHIDEE